jgi:AGCS family alanine or glycine:cation symporter
MPGPADPNLEPAKFTSEAFATSPMGNIGTWIVVISIVFFAYSTILGWAYYGEKCCVELFGLKILIPYRLLYSGMTFVGATIHLTLVWGITDVLNGLMALPNLIGLLLLSGLISRETRDYLRQDPQLRRTDVPIPPLQTLRLGKGYTDLSE